MLEVFYGNNTVAVREAAFSRVAKEEEQGVRVELIDSDTYQPGILEDAVGAASLFGEVTLYVLDTPSSSGEFKEAVSEAAPALAESANLFIVIEGALLAADKKVFSKVTNSVTEHKADTKERFNTFAFADALARKDKKTLWLLLQQARAAQIATEEIIGVLWWQLKTLRLAAKTSSASEAGLKDFPYNKAKRSLTKFKDGELEALSLSLLTVYHDGHGGLVNIDEALERWLLTL